MEGDNTENFRKISWQTLQYISIEHVFEDKTPTTDGKQLIEQSPINFESGNDADTFCLPSARNSQNSKEVIQIKSEVTHFATCIASVCLKS